LPGRIAAPVIEQADLSSESEEKIDELPGGARASGAGGREAEEQASTFSRPPLAKGDEMTESAS
jgi:hypothetical protein